ncbi:TPA: hypothetical protein RS749_001153 [Mannheimia haemolytica]|nr:hypothetical protein [Mannheimia haemolytica]HDZ6813937.1 hypothetical protein [Mannheimia haemolytica]
MRLAIRHYLNNDKGTKTPLFTFLSLYSETEPYPLPELLIVLGNRIAKLEQQHNAMPNETDSITLGILRKQLAQLLKVAARIKE